MRRIRHANEMFLKGVHQHQRSTVNRASVRGTNIGDAKEVGASTSQDVRRSAVANYGRNF